jgi:hypothetical protein
LVPSLLTAGKYVIDDNDDNDNDNDNDNDDSDAIPTQIINDTKNDTKESTSAKLSLLSSLEVTPSLSSSVDSTNVNKIIKRLATDVQRICAQHEVGTLRTFFISATTVPTTTNATYC